MKKKSSLEKQKEQPSECDVCRRCKLNVNQQNEEFISKEELDKRNASPKEKMATLLCTCSCFSKELLYMATPEPSASSHCISTTKKNCTPIRTTDINL